jgi:hypothetical protein
VKQDPETLGRYLKRARETRHVTIEEIALFVQVQRSLADALEADDSDAFSRRSECLGLVKKYIAYLNLNQTDVLRRFEAQWKKSGSVKRYPKLTQFADREASRKESQGFKVKKLFAGHSPAKTAWVSLTVGLAIVLPFLFHYLPEWRPVLPTPEHSPPSGVEKKATPAAERVPPPAINPGMKAGALKRAPAIDPLYSPPGRPARNLLSPPAAATPAPLPKGSHVVGNRDTKRYHLPGMKYHDKVKAYHRVVFQSEREAIRAGYVKARE